MADDSSTTAEQILEQAFALRRERRLREALDLFKDVLSGRHGDLGAKHPQWAYIQALKSCTRLQSWSEAEELARQAIRSIPKFAYGQQCLGEALLHLGRPTEARAALKRALKLDPDLDSAHALLQLVTAGGVQATPAARPRPWPKRQADFDDPRELIQRFLLRRRPRDRFIGPETVFTTLGSCFADNLADRLRAAGYTAYSERIGEEVNSTYANRYLLEWVESGATSPQTAAIAAAYGEASRERLRRAIADCDVFVMTLGVAPSYFDDATGQFVFVSQNSSTEAGQLGRYVMRTTTVAENVENTRQIIAAVRRIAARPLKVVLTVSPVPLAATTELESAITADCLSKSTLRVACHEVVSAEPPDGLIYWPSFEIVRWLGTHLGRQHPPAYGADDGNTRHVSQWLIDLIVKQFLKFHAAAAEG